MNTTRSPYTLDLSRVGRDPLHEAPDSWATRVRAPRDGAPRHYLRELAVSLGAARILVRDTTRTEAVFDLLGSFPTRELLAAAARHLPILDDPRLDALWQSRSMPDLRLGTVRRFLTELPPESLGHAYARYVVSRGLDNAFLEWMTIDEPATYLAFRMGHLHDLFHFLLGYEPRDRVGEMEVEAFLLAQSGALNHVLFLGGFATNLVATGHARALGRGLPRLWAAYRLGSRVEPLLLQRWEDLLARPLVDVRRELGIAGRPLGLSREVVPKPALAHVVLNVPDRAAAERFYQDIFGYALVGRDDALGVSFLTAGNDHHTVALSELPPRTPLGLARALPRLARRVYRLVAPRFSRERSSSGQRVVLPPPALIRAGMRHGLQHIGFRVPDEAALRAAKQHLEMNGIHILWAVNHGDLIKGIYFRDAGGNLCEIFCDSPAVRARQAELERAGVTLDASHVRPGDLRSYDLDLARELDPPAPAPTGRTA